MENKIAYLQMIQFVINRLSNNSFLMKGWAITLVAGTFVLSAKDANKSYIALAYFPSIMFWALDAYFVSQERLFRSLYDRARLQELDKIDFSMDVASFKNWQNSWSSGFLSLTLLIFYGSISLAILLVAILL